MVLSRTPGEPLRAAEWGVPRPPPSTRPASAGLLPPRAWGPGRCSSALETGPQRPSAPAVQFLPLTTSACQEGSDLHARLPPAPGEDPCSGHPRPGPHTERRWPANVGWRQGAGPCRSSRSTRGKVGTAGPQFRSPALLPSPPPDPRPRHGHTATPSPEHTCGRAFDWPPPPPEGPFPRCRSLLALGSTSPLPHCTPLPASRSPPSPPSCFQPPAAASAITLCSLSSPPRPAQAPDHRERGHRVAAAVQNLPQAGSRGNTQGCPWTRGLSHGEIRNLVEQGNARGPGMHGSPSRGPGAVQLPGPAPRSHRFPDMRIMDVCPDWSPPASCSSAPGPPVTPARGLNRSAEAP
ncbi:uncharacterized protein LOC144281779 [Canis aureus]